MTAIPKTKLTVEQYLENERKADFKSEFYKGEMLAMAGPGSWGFVSFVGLSNTLLEQYLFQFRCLTSTLVLSLNKLK